MQLIDKTAITCAIAGAAMTAIGVGIPFAYPNLAPEVWEWVVLGSVDVLAASLIYLLHLHLRWRRRLISSLIITTGLILTIGGVVIYNRRVPTKEGDGNTAIDNKISFNCLPEPRPTRARPDKAMKSLQIIEPYPGKLLPASVAHMFMPPGDRELKVEPHTAPDWVVRCTLTNYANIPFFRVSVPLVVEWREVTKTDNGTAPDKVIATFSANRTSPIGGVDRA
jgi:hypothetical protein